MPSSTTNGAAAILGTRTPGYRPGLIASSAAWMGSGGNYGLFNLADVEEMRKDYQVDMCLGFRAAPLYTAEVEVECQDHALQDFVIEQRERFWAKSLATALECQPYGYCGAEPLYTRNKEGVYHFDSLKGFLYRDVKPWTYGGKLQFIRVTNCHTGAGDEPQSGQASYVDLPAATGDRPAKGIWFVHEPRTNPWYGQAIAMRQWLPWRFKYMPDGMNDTLLKFFYKFSISCVIVRAPNETYIAEGDAVERQGADLMREMVENIKAGGVLVMSCDMDEQGQYKYSVEQWGKPEGEASSLIDGVNYYDTCICRAAGIPDEILTHQGNVGGYSRSMIAASAFLCRCEQSLNHILELWDMQCLRPLVALNQRLGHFPDVPYRLKAKPLVMPDAKPGGGEQGAPGGGGAPKPPGGQAGPEKPPAPEKPKALQFSLFAETGVFYHGSHERFDKLHSGSWVTPYKEDAYSFAIPWSSSDLVDAGEDDPTGRPVKLEKLRFKPGKEPPDSPIYIYRVKGKTSPAKTNTGAVYAWNRSIDEDLPAELVDEIPSWKKAAREKKPLQFSQEDTGGMEPQHWGQIVREAPAVRIVGNSGSGKTLLAQAIAANTPGKFIALDPLWEPGAWGGLPAVHVAPDGSYDPIARAVDLLVEELKRRISLLQQGIKSFEPLVIVADEIPATVIEVPKMGLFIRRLVQFGRHASMKLVGIAQSERVGAWGLESYGDVNESFCTIFLGRKALDMMPDLAGSERPAVIEWRGKRYAMDLSQVPAMAQKPIPRERLFRLPEAHDVGMSGFDESKVKRDEKGEFAEKGGKSEPAHHPGSVHGSAVTIKPVKHRVFDGEPVPTKTTLTKQETGRVGEAVVLAYLKYLGFKDSRPMNKGETNFPIDLIEDSRPTEVKAGLVSNGKDAQKWRLTFSKESAKEKELYEQMNPEERAEWNAEKQQRIRQRKEAVIKDLGKKGRKVMPRTMTAVINPDTMTADLYEFDGFHDIIRWNSPEAKKAYKGTVKYAH